MGRSQAVIAPVLPRSSRNWIPLGTVAHSDHRHKAPPVWTFIDLWQIPDVLPFQPQINRSIAVFPEAMDICPIAESVPSEHEHSNGGLTLLLSEAIVDTQLHYYTSKRWMIKWSESQSSAKATHSLCVALSTALSPHWVQPDVICCIRVWLWNNGLSVTLDHQTELTLRNILLPWKNTMDFMAVFRGPRRVDEGVVPNQTTNVQSVVVWKTPGENSVKGNEDLSPIVAQWNTNKQSNQF